MYELDHRKDQVMTVCKVALANLGMWVRDPLFPDFLRACDAGSGWFLFSDSLVASCAMPPRSRWNCVPQNDRALNRDLALLCERVNQASPQLPDGHFLRFTLSSPCRFLPVQEQPVT